MITTLLIFALCLGFSIAGAAFMYFPLDDNREDE
jgi:hypothetical protein